MNIMLMILFHKTRQKEKTRKCKGTLNPIWEQSFQMFISPNSEFLMIEVFDQTSKLLFVVCRLLFVVCCLLFVIVLLVG